MHIIIYIKSDSSKAATTKKNKKTKTNSKANMARQKTMHKDKGTSDRKQIGQKRRPSPKKVYEMEKKAAKQAAKEQRIRDEEAVEIEEDDVSVDEVNEESEVEQPRKKVRKVAEKKQRSVAKVDRNGTTDSEESEEEVAMELEETDDSEEESEEEVKKPKKKRAMKTAAKKKKSGSKITKRKTTKKRKVEYVEESDDEPEDDDVEVGWDDMEDEELEERPIETSDWKDVKIAENVHYEQGSRYLVISGGRKSPEEMKKILSKLWSNGQVWLRILRATGMFRFIRKANVISGGSSGARLSEDEPFRFEPCDGIVRINSVQGATRYAIREKIFIKFTGYMLDKNGQIAMVAGSVMEMEPVYGRNATRSREFVENMFEGPTSNKIRWAEVSDVWNEYMMAKRLLKYLLSHGVDEKYWRNGYDQVWKNEDEKPLETLQWSAAEEF